MPRRPSAPSLPGSVWPSAGRGRRPMADERRADGSYRSCHGHFVGLVSAKNVKVAVIFGIVEADMALRAVSRASPENEDRAKARIDRPAELKPVSGKVRIGRQNCARQGDSNAGFDESPHGGPSNDYPVRQVRAPSTGSKTPETYLASSEARNNDAWATSQAVPILPMGTMASRWAIMSSTEA